MVTVLTSLALFVVAGLCEIGGLSHVAVRPPDRANSARQKLFLLYPHTRHYVGTCS